MTHVIETQGLTKYFGGRPVVRGLNLRVPQGSVYGFLGRNGAGKSTTIKMLLGLLAPDRGTARVLGEAAADLRPSTRARIAYIAEHHPFYRWMTIDEALRFHRSFHPATWNGRLVDLMLDHFGLARRKRIRQLSHGQRAQVCLTLALAPDPDLLVLDDPTLGLDTIVRRDFLESMIHLIQREGRTVFFSSHILTDVERVADRIGILVDGVLRVDCPTEAFKQSVKKVVLYFRGPVPELPACPGLVGTRVMGSQREAVFVGFDEEQRRACESLEPQHWEVLDLNLEDAFIEYTRGPRRSLPHLTQETNDVEIAGV